MYWNAHGWEASGCAVNQESDITENSRSLWEINKGTDKKEKMGKYPRYWKTSKRPGKNQ